jgi:hypothetical protein
MSHGPSHPSVNGLHPERMLHKYRPISIRLPLLLCSGRFVWMFDGRSSSCLIRLFSIARWVLWSLPDYTNSIFSFAHLEGTKVWVQPLRGRAKGMVTTMIGLTNEGELTAMGAHSVEVSKTFSGISLCSGLSPGSILPPFAWVLEVLSSQNASVSGFSHA